MVNNSALKAIRILELLGASEKPLSLKQISEELGLPKSTAHGLLQTLVATSFLELHKPASYAIGLRAFEVGAAYIRRAGPVGIVAPELVGLTRALGVTAHYAVLDGPDAVYLCKEDPPGLGVQLASSIGARLPADITAVGKACLAWLDDAVVGEHAGHNAEVAVLRAQLTAVRERGYATDEGEAATGIWCVAAPVFDMGGPRGAIGVSFLRGARDDAEGIAQHVMAAAARATSQLGGTVRR